MKEMRVALVQMAVVSNKSENVRRGIQYVEQAKNAGADLVMLPEMFCCPYETKNFPIYAEPEGGPAFQLLSAAAKNAGVYLIAGSMPERDENGNIYNTSYAFDRAGVMIGKHRKAHLFDIHIEGGQHFKESETLTPGSSATVFLTEFGKIGLAICYDFRFPELCRKMVDLGAEILCIPAAFNMTTGPAHWELLFRSRAVDHQVFTLGAAPARDTSSSYVSYGNSIIVSPWGTVIGRLEETEGLLVRTIDLEEVPKIRKELPLLQHRKPSLY